MPVPQLPADNQNPWGQLLRDALTDISNRADQGITDAGTAQSDIDVVSLIVDEHDLSIVSQDGRLDTLETTITTKANDNAVVKTTGNQSISGTKTFNTAPVVPDGSFAFSKVTNLQNTLNGKAPINNPTFTGDVVGVSKAMVGLANVNNTTDAAKPVSTAQQAALDLKASTSEVNNLIQTHNHSGGVNGVNLPVSSVTNLQSLLDGKQNSVIFSSSSAVNSFPGWTIQTSFLLRWGPIAYIYLEFSPNQQIVGDQTGNIFNKEIGWITTFDEFANTHVGPGGAARAMRYSLTSNTTGRVANGHISAEDGHIWLDSFGTPDNLPPGSPLTLAGMFILNSGVL